MSVVRGPSSTWSLDAPEGTALTLGVFDGVHLGHQHILHLLAARADGRPVVVMTFDPHPVEVIAPEFAPPALTSLDHRIELLHHHGADIVAVLPFTEETRMMSAETFAQEVVGGSLAARFVVVGDDFHFGYRMKGDVDLLADIGRDVGFDVEAIPIVGGDAPIRSTTIRDHLAAGRVEEAAAMLGRPFRVRDVVRMGDRRGHQLGFPTANLEPDPGMMRPGRGVYAARAHLGGGEHHAVVNVGVRPTVDGTVERVEVHVLDWDGDLYGRTIDVDFVARLRNERRFDSLDDLVAQIARDVDRARETLTT